MISGWAKVTSKCLFSVLLAVEGTAYFLLLCREIAEVLRQDVLGGFVLFLSKREATE